MLRVEKQPGDTGRALRLVGVWVFITGAAVLVGLQMDGATGVDRSISEWLANHRSVTWNEVTATFSGFADTLSVVAIALLAILVTALFRRTAGVMLIVVAMIGEITMFLTITLLVDRSRPDVPRLDGAPPTSSFPSGHTFATFVVWTSIAVLAERQAWRTPLRQLARVLAVVMPAAVGASRVYRGMHHPTDVLAALVLGTLWVTAVVLIVVPRIDFESRSALGPLHHRRRVETPSLLVEGGVDAADDDLALRRS